jgi:hypothetical protein
MYTFFYRSAPYPMLETFDVPTFNQTCTRRDRSNTPLQALTVANDEAMYEAARALARRVLEAGSGTLDDRLIHLFRLCFARPPQAAEVAALLAFWQHESGHFAAEPQAAQDVAPRDMAAHLPAEDAAAWVATARVLLNLDEFITRE